MSSIFKKSNILSHGYLTVLAAPIVALVAMPMPTAAAGFLWESGDSLITTGSVETPRKRSRAKRDEDEDVSERAERAERRRARHARRHRHRDDDEDRVVSKKYEKEERKVAAEGAKPRGPLVIAISVQQQKLKIYDANGLFAESPISSGMKGHPTPMGVFSVIQKNKHHRSNIYSGAPMPYMQRITWSGIALHAGVLPGYPASHGCIRMPMSFAIKMWNWTRMGARVIVTPGEVSPSDFSHPLLAALAPSQSVASSSDLRSPELVKTADASLGIARNNLSVMVDIAPAGIAAAPKVSVDHLQVAESATSRAASEPLAPPVAAPAAITNDGMPPLPMPAPLDLSDITAVKAADTNANAAATAQTPAGTTKLKTDTQVDVSVSAKADVGKIAKDQAAESASPAALIKSNSPVAIFVSRKDRKIYVRQNFMPVIDMPIEIASGDKDVGTHIFTARDDNTNGKKLQWSVVSLPAVVRERDADDEEKGRRHRRVATVEKPAVQTDSAQEALERLAMPADLMARLGTALPPGSSLVVSDQGIAQGETGSGTDFILILR